MPLYFERQISKDSGATHKLPLFDNEIKNKKRAIITSQIFLTVASVSFTTYVASQWIKSIVIRGGWDYSHLFVWSEQHDWKSDIMKLLVGSLSLNSISLCTILAGLFYVK